MIGKYNRIFSSKVKRKYAVQEFSSTAVSSDSLPVERAGADHSACRGLV
jgi:hypothetical protein